jgi:hypothetical protein
MPQYLQFSPENYIYIDPPGTDALIAPYQRYLSRNCFVWNGLEVTWWTNALPVILF